MKVKEISAKGQRMSRGCSQDALSGRSHQIEHQRYDQYTQHFPPRLRRYNIALWLLRWWWCYHGYGLAQRVRCTGIVIRSGSRLVGEKEVVTFESK